MCCDGELQNRSSVWRVSRGIHPDRLPVFRAQGCRRLTSGQHGRGRGFAVRAEPEAALSGYVPSLQTFAPIIRKCFNPAADMMSSKADAQIKVHRCFNVAFILLCSATCHLAPGCNLSQPVLTGIQLRMVNCLFHTPSAAACSLFCVYSIHPYQ